MSERNVDPLQRPRLRLELERFPEQSRAGLVLYDPAQRRLFELDAADQAVLDLLDGGRSPREIARRAGRSLEQVLELLDDLSDLSLLADPDQEDYLAALRRAHEAEDELLQPILDICPPWGTESLPLQVVDDARHTCLHCGACCHYAVPLSPEERVRLEAVDWPQDVIPPESGRLFQLRPGRQWGGLEETIATRSAPTRCAFLDEQNYCRVQRCLGPLAKPFPCRLFPLAYPVRAAQSLIFSLTFECHNVYASYENGERLADREQELRALVAEMEDIYVLPDTIPLSGADSVDLERYLAWEGGLFDLPWVPATQPEACLEGLGRHWERLSNQPGRILTPAQLAHLAAVLAQSLRQNRAALADSPEGLEGIAWAGQVLRALEHDPAQAWAALPWAEGVRADCFLQRFVRHYLEGKQHLLFQPLRQGLRALALLLLLARVDAGRLAGAEEISMALLNRALSRWCRLLDFRPLRLAFLGEAGG
ncbi:MAG: YkgJ family cysteine cluster protein [Chloroflexia bacterium]|nr:YkgJ family cysteine cluster protein [Chloroflexia bacterium]